MVNGPHINPQLIGAINAQQQQQRMFAEQFLLETHRMIYVELIRKTGVVPPEANVVEFRNLMETCAEMAKLATEVLGLKVGILTRKPAS